MYAKIKDGVVIEVFECSHVPDNTVECHDEVVAGWEYNEGVFSKPFSLMKTEKIQALNQWHDEQAFLMKAKYSKTQTEAFLKKEAEANAWRLDNSTPTPYVLNMCGGDPELTKAELNAILSKIDAVAVLDGYVGTKQSEIKAATTKQELDAITW